MTEKVRLKILEQKLHETRPIIAAAQPKPKPPWWRI